MMISLSSLSCSYWCGDLLEGFLDGEESAFVHDVGHHLANGILHEFHIVLEDGFDGGNVMPVALDGIGLLEDTVFLGNRVQLDEPVLSFQRKRGGSDVFTLRYLPVFPFFFRGGPKKTSNPLSFTR